MTSDLWGSPVPEARPSRWVIRKRMLAAVSAFAIPLGFSGCSGEPVEAATEAELRSVESVRARLDSEAGKIGMPLDEVLYSSEDRVLVKQANNILMGECLAKSKINLSKDFGVFKPHPERRQVRNLGREAGRRERLQHDGRGASESRFACALRQSGRLQGGLCGVP